MELTAYHWSFIAEMLVDGEPTKACRRAGYEGPYARAEGAKLMRNQKVAEQYEALISKSVTKSALKAQEVIDDIANVLRADPRDLIEHWTGACRYCYGHEHRYHRTPREYEDAQCERDFKPMGGVGFNARREPHPDCPECWGEGEPYERIKDTRELTKEQAALYIGVEKTKYGTKLLMRSKDSARDAAARLLGLNKETVNLNVKKETEMTDDELIAMARGEIK